MFIFGITLAMIDSLLSAAEEIQELWQEYENNSSLEANLVKDFDKVCIYRHSNPILDLEYDR
jgi:5'-deoxynucleotidase YfbR-like HD superfamily hydrolase